MDRGTQVRFTKTLSAIERGKAGTATRFVGKVEPGQLGLYQEPTVIDDENCWHIIQFGAWDIVAATDQFETA